MRRYFAVTNLTRGRRLADRVRMADGWWSRLLGLLGREPLSDGEGLLLVPCRAVHLFGMRYPLDVVFLDRSGAVVAVYHHLAPGSRSAWHWSAAIALEVRAGTLARTDTRPGDALSWAPALGAA